MGQGQHQQIPVAEHMGIAVAAVEGALHHGAVGQDGALAAAGGAAGEHDYTGIGSGAGHGRRLFLGSGGDLHQCHMLCLCGSHHSLFLQLRLIDQLAQSKLHAAAEHRARIQLGRQDYSSAAGGGDGQKRLDKVIGVGGQNAHPGTLFQLQHRAEGSGIGIQPGKGILFAVILDGNGIRI